MHEATSTGDMMATKTKDNVRCSLTIQEKRSAQKRLIDRIGGPTTLRQIVDTFYHYVMEDTYLVHFFDDVDMGLLHGHQYKFLESLMAFSTLEISNTTNFNLPRMDIVQFMISKHNRLFREKGLSEEHFDLVLDHLQQAFQQHDVETSAIHEIHELLQGLRIVFEERAALEQEKQFTLLMKLGGPTRLKQVVRILYDRLTADPQLSSLVTALIRGSGSSPDISGSPDDNTNATEQEVNKHYLNKFLEMLLTENPNDMDLIQYVGKRYQQHLLFGGSNNNDLVITQQHFDLFLEHLLASLPQSKELAPKTIEEIKTRVETFGNIIVTAAAASQQQKDAAGAANYTSTTNGQELQELRQQNQFLLNKVTTMESKLLNQNQEIQQLKNNVTKLTEQMQQITMMLTTTTTTNQPQPQPQSNNMITNGHAGQQQGDHVVAAASGSAADLNSTATNDGDGNNNNSDGDHGDDARMAVVEGARRATMAINWEDLHTQTSSSSSPRGGGGGAGGGDGGAPSPSTLQDFYQVEPILLGEGGYGQVFACTHLQSGYERAVKIVPKCTPNDDEQQQQQQQQEGGGGETSANEEVLREFHILRSLDSPNLLKVYDMFEDTEQFYILSDIYKGGDLLSVLHEMGSLAEEDVQEIMNTMLTCINYCHQKNLVHRDIKPENVLLEEHLGFEDIKIIDFGLAATLEEKDSDGCLHEGVGSIYYVSPQVIQGTYTSKCDIWSTGVVAFILLTGYLPFCGPSDEATYEKIVNGEMDFDFEDPAWEGISDEAMDFVSELLSYEEEDRPTAEMALDHPWLKSFRSNCLREDSSKRSSVQTSLARLKSSSYQQSKLRNATYAIIASRLLSKPEKEKIDLNFRNLDINCDGFLCHEDLKTSSKELQGESMTKEEIDEVFKHVNLSRSGKITYSEFAVAMMMEENMVDECKLRAAFNIFDREGKGHISINDIKKVLGLGDELDDYIINTLIGPKGSTNDGTISFEAFIGMMKDTKKQKTMKRKKPRRTPRRGTLGIVEAFPEPQRSTKPFKRLTLL